MTKHLTINARFYFRSRTLLVSPLTFFVFESNRDLCVFIAPYRRLQEEEHQVRPASLPAIPNPFPELCSPTGSPILDTLQQNQASDTHVRKHTHTHAYTHIHRSVLCILRSLVCQDSGVTVEVSRFCRV